MKQPVSKPEKSIIIDKLQNDIAAFFSNGGTVHTVDSSHNKDANTRQDLSADRTYNVIYADPPWQYEFSRSDSREIENHYPTTSRAWINCVPSLWHRARKQD
jgi:16S rRNA G966 N2-methylase RsmD